MGALLQSFLAERALEAGKVQPSATGRALEAKFDEQDWLGWSKSFFTWVQGIRPHDWLPEPRQPSLLPNVARVAVLGDWGTGLYGAPVCASSIESDRGRFDLVVHLGDVYYSGTAREIGERFLALWPRRTDAVSRALNSNHEMYTGGYGYFDITLPVFRQDSSVFAVQNDHWLLVGLDTAFMEHDISASQSQWLLRLVSEAADRRVILFSHHQPYSLFESGGDALVASLSETLGTRRVFAWYWGHEHRCVLFEPDAASGLLGRCVGHSGYPYYRTLVGDAPVQHRQAGHVFHQFGPGERGPGGLVLDGDNPYVEGYEKEYGPNGYMTLELSGKDLHEVVHTPDGTVLWETTHK